MNHQEIETCVLRAKSGDTAALLSLFNQYKPFIIKSANAIFIKNYEPSDLLQIGYITLINAVMKYKIGLHAFSPYVYTAIKNAMYYTLRQNKNHIKVISLNQSPSETDEGEILDLLCTVEGIEEPFFRDETSREVRKALKELNPKELELIVMLFYSDYTLKRYTELKGISYITGIRRKNRILEKLRKKFREDK